MRLPPFATLLVLSSLLTAPWTGAAAGTLTIDADEAVRLALAASHLVVAADARLDAGASAVSLADAARLPEVTTTAVVQQRSAVPELAVPLGGPGSPPQTLFPSIETTYLAGMSVSQPLYSGGAISKNRQAARLDLSAAEAERLRAIADLSLNVRSTFWQTVAAAAAVTAARTQSTRARRLLDDANALREAGMAIEADQLAARARVAAAEIAVIRAETARQTADAALRSLLGCDAGTRLELSDRRAERTPSAPQQLSVMVTTARDHRAELQAADAHIEAITARQQVVSAARRPSLALTGQWEMARPNPRSLPLTDSWNDSWAVGLVARWTVFDGDRVRDRAATIKAEQRAAEAERDELLRLISLEVERAHLELTAALAALPAAATAQAAAAAREAAVRDRYSAGLTPIQELLDAQAELASAEGELIRTRATAWIAEAALRRAVGR